MKVKNSILLDSIFFEAYNYLLSLHIPASQAKQLLNGLKTLKNQLFVVQEYMKHKPNDQTLFSDYFEFDLSNKIRLGNNINISAMYLKALDSIVEVM